MPKITKTLYVSHRSDWRAWLKKHHDSEKEIWLIYYKKHSGKPRIAYNDAVEEALCYGWIDSTAKKIDEEKFAQRFTPRKNTNNWSELNKERIRRLAKLGKIAPAGFAKVKNVLKHEIGKSGKLSINPRFVTPPDILEALKQDKKTWEHFNKFPESYKRIRIGWIEAARHRPEIFKQRLNYFLRMTAKNKRFGMIQ